MTIVFAILICAGLFALSAFLRQPRRCGGHCAGCIGACERGDAASAERKRIHRGHLKLETSDD